MNENENANVNEEVVPVTNDGGMKITKTDVIVGTPIAGLAAFGLYKAVRGIIDWVNDKREERRLKKEGVIEDVTEVVEPVEVPEEQ